MNAILTFLDGQDLLTLEDVRAALARELDDAGPGALVALRARLSSPDDDWGYAPRDPLAQRIHHVLADRLLEPASRLQGERHLGAIGARPVVIVANHLSYADANLLEILLHRSGHAAVANRLTAIAGPKVFTSRQRHFSSLCFGTIRTPQSHHVASEQAALGVRAVARASRRSIESARQRLADGDALVLFPEGTRSRTRGMQRLLVGATRYLDTPSTVVLPVGITGTDTLFPIGEEALHPVTVVARVGPPVDPHVRAHRARGNRRVIMDALGFAIADLLPPSSRGVYGDGAGLDPARQVLAAATGRVDPPPVR